MKKRYRIVLEEVTGPADDESAEIKAVFNLNGVEPAYRWKIGEELLEDLKAAYKLARSPRKVR